MQSTRVLAVQGDLAAIPGLARDGLDLNGPCCDRNLAANRRATSLVSSSDICRPLCRHRCTRRPLSTIPVCRPAGPTPSPSASLPLLHCMSSMSLLGEGHESLVRWASGRSCRPSSSGRAPFPSKVRLLGTHPDRHQGVVFRHVRETGEIVRLCQVSWRLGFTDDAVWCGCDGGIAAIGRQRATFIAFVALPLALSLPLPTS